MDDVKYRVAAGGRKHRFGRARIDAAMDNAVELPPVGDQRWFIGVDDRNVELLIGMIPDDRNAEMYTVIHVTPTAWGIDPRRER